MQVESTSWREVLFLLFPCWDSFLLTKRDVCFKLWGSIKDLRFYMRLETMCSVLPSENSAAWFCCMYMFNLYFLKLHYDICIALCHNLAGWHQWVKPFPLGSLGSHGFMVHLATSSGRLLPPPFPSVLERHKVCLLSCDSSLPLFPDVFSLTFDVVLWLSVLMLFKYILSWIAQACLI